MKTIRRIQNVLVAAGIITAVALVDGIEADASSTWSAFVIISFSILTVVERELNGKQNEEGRDV